MVDLQNKEYVVDHALPCPHLDYIKTLIERIGLDVREGTVISDKSEQRRRGGSCRR